MQSGMACDLALWKLAKGSLPCFMSWGRKERKYILCWRVFLYFFFFSFDFLVGTVMEEPLYSFVLCMPCIGTVMASFYCKGRMYCTVWTNNTTGNHLSATYGHYLLFGRLVCLLMSLEGLLLTPYARIRGLILMIMNQEVPIKCTN